MAIQEAAMPEAPPIDYSSFFAWAMAGVASAISTLLGGVIAMWKLNETRNATEIAENKKEIQELKLRCDKCEDDRTDLLVTCARMETRLQQVEKKVDQ